LDYKVPLESFKSVLQVAQQRKMLPVVQCESRVSNADDSYHIGKIDKLNPASLSLLEFDAIGGFGTEPTAIPHGEVPPVQFETSYSKTLTKHLLSPSSIRRAY